MSFLIDPPLLYATGRALAKRTPSATSQPGDALIEASTMAVFWGVSISLYLDRGWTRPIWRLCRASSGRDWMLNSGVLGLDWRRAGTTTHAISTAIFATYPVWLWLGVRHGRERVGDRKGPRGTAYAASSTGAAAVPSVSCSIT